MSRSRFISIRSYGLGIIAALATMITFGFPAHARTFDMIEPGYHVMSIADLHMPLIIEHVDVVAAIVPQTHDATIHDVAQPPVLLKPEYAESYETHGLNFIDLRRLC